MNIENYLTEIVSRFPELKEATPRLVEQGWNHDVVILDDDLIFRFPKTERARKRLKTEASFLASFADDSPLPIPNYRYLADDQSFGGYQKISGRTLRKSHYDRLRKDSKSAVVSTIGGFLNSLHGLPIDDARALGITESKLAPWGRDHAERFYRGVCDYLYPELDGDVRNWLERQFTGYLSLRFTGPKRVVHYDLTTDNILYEPDDQKLSGILDFADIEISDPAVDFASLWVYGKAFVEAVLAAYNAVSVDQDFMDRSQYPIRLAPALQMLRIWRSAAAEPPLAFEHMHDELRRAMALYPA